jgi:DNA-binding transcriptional LysR family regulator
LKALESKLPYALFAFQGRRKVLTPFGLDLYVRLRDRIHGIQDVINQTASIHSDPVNATVRIAARREILDRIADRLKFPGVLIYAETNNENTIRSLLNREVDIGIVHQMPDTHELSAKAIFKDNFVICIPKKLIAKQPATERELWSTIKSLPCIGYKLQDEILQKICAGNKVTFNEIKIVRSTSNYTSISKMVDAGFGWAAMPAHIPISLNQNWIIPVSNKVFPPRQFFSVHRTEVKSSSWLRLLLKELENCFLSNVHY